jgi:indolepyruvate ferredoxin oxidoreductase beta subunit
MKSLQPICVQIAALGGQGGGVLAEWLAEAAHHSGFPAQVTSIPGVAQRTGATTYYFEMYPDREPKQKPVFCLTPDTDGLDLMIAMEPLEAARALDLGLITDRTTVLTARTRIYSTAEKTVAGDGAVDTDVLLEALEGAAKSVIAVDVDALSAKPGAPGNAVMFGVVAASGVLPMAEQDFHEAIRIKGVAVNPSLVDFASGFSQETAPSDDVVSNDNVVLEPAPSELLGDIEKLPTHCRDLIGHICSRLIDYQDISYARLYLKRLSLLMEMEPAALQEVAKRLGAWMTYEDVMRVAQLKTRPGRLARIRSEIGVDGRAPLDVTEFLKPGREEFASLLPPGLGRLVMRNHKSSSTAGLRLRLPTTTPYGYGALKVLASLKSWRLKTYRYELEQAAIERWLEVISQTITKDTALALKVAELAVLARGYGGVRARGLEKLNELFGEWAHKIGDDLSALTVEVDKLLHQARHDPDKDCGKTG